MQDLHKQTTNILPHFFFHFLCDITIVHCISIDLSSSEKGFYLKKCSPSPTCRGRGRKKYIFWFFNRRHKIWAENQHNSVQIQDADIIIFCSLTLLSKKIPWLPRTVRSALHLSIISELQCSLKTSWSPCTVDENNISQPFFNWV